MAAVVANTQWEYEWSDAKAYIDEVGNNEFTGLLLPTPKSCFRDSANPVESFTWHHLAPAMGFKVSGNGSKIRITPLPVLGSSPSGVPYNGYPYSEGWTPKITFSYKNSSGNYVTIASFETESEYTGSYKESGEISDVSNADIYVTCGASACGLYGVQNHLACIKLDIKPDAPTISATTGKTITVTNGSDGLFCVTTNSGWKAGSTFTFTGLTQGKSYSFKCKKDNSDGTFVESDEVSGKTWSISGQTVGSSPTSMTFKATHVAGTNGNANSHTITYNLYTSKSTSGSPVAVKTGGNGVPVTFSDLQSGTTYYCYAYTTNLGNGDNNCWIDASSTGGGSEAEGGDADVSATTLRTTVTWNSAGAKSVVCKVTCNGSTVTLNSSGSYIGFTGLTPGSTYTISYEVISTYEYEYTYIEKDEEGNETEITKVETEVQRVTGSSRVTTKKCALGNIEVSTKIIQFKSSSNYSSDTMEESIDGNTWSTVSQNTYKIFNNLNHNSSYTIYCRIYGCYAFNSSGNRTSYNDSVVSKTVSTKKLSLEGSMLEEHQHSLITLWQSYVDGVAIDKDSIDNTKFEFSYMDTIAKKNNPPYQASEVIEGSAGNTTGTYSVDKKVYSNDLPWYYCEYIVTVSLTDGHNIVSKAITCHTIFPAAWIYSGGSWHRYMPHVYTNGKWVPAPAFIYKDNKYTEPNGE